MAAGWDATALYHTVAVTALFNFMNRLVEGLGIELNRAYVNTASKRPANRGYLPLLDMLGQSLAREEDSDDGPMSEQATRSRISQICRCCLSDGIPRRSFLVALLVGTILNLINQGDVLLGYGQLNLAKVILTFAVPYCVATYGAVSYRLTVSRARE